jgi:hypothetical protein
MLHVPHNGRRVPVMKKSLSTLVLVIFTVSTICSSCGDVGVAENPARTITELETVIKESPEFQRLLAIRNDMLLRALRSTVTGREIRDAYAGIDVQRFGSTLGYSEQEWRELGAELGRLARTLHERYPELMDAPVEMESGCPTCDASRIAERWDAYRNERVTMPLDGDSNQIPTPDPSDKGVHCYWVKYTIALVACAASGNPIFYFVCAFIALCAYCSGGWVSSLCSH